MPKKAIITFGALLCFVLHTMVGRGQGKLPVEGFEAYFGAGLTHFSGDLGPSNGSVALNTSTLNFAVGGGLRYYMTNHWAVRATGHYGRLSAFDSLATNVYRKQRNLNFKSDIYDVALQIEYSLFNYNIRGLSKKLYNTRRNSRHNIYFFTGISMFHFNPYGELNGKWYSLHKLSTSGQGLPGGAAPYKLYSFTIPIGGGYKYLINKTVSIGFEVTFRKTFTDYIDDVSGAYYDNNLLRQYKGDVAADIADKSKTKDGLKQAAGKLRGNPNSNDNFAFILITINKKLNFHRSAKRDIPCFNNSLE